MNKLDRIIKESIQKVLMRESGEPVEFGRYRGYYSVANNGKYNILKNNNLLSKVWFDEIVSDDWDNDGWIEVVIDGNPAYLHWDGALVSDKKNVNNRKKRIELRGQGEDYDSYGNRL